MEYVVNQLIGIRGFGDILNCQMELYDIDAVGAGFKPAPTYTKLFPWLNRTNVMSMVAQKVILGHAVVYKYLNFSKKRRIS